MAAMLLAAAMVLAACSKKEGSSYRPSATMPTTAVTSARPTPHAVSLTPEEVERLYALVAPSVAASQRDVFGKEVIKQTGFDVDAKGAVVVVELLGISQLLLKCDGTITTTDGGRVPYAMTVVVEFGAFEIANLASRVFSHFSDADALELHFVARVRDKYGQLEEWTFFSSVITRQQAAKMNWDWFRGVVLRGAFDPTAFKEFAIYFGEPPTSQDMGLILEAISENSRSLAVKEYGRPNPGVEALNRAVQIANWFVCALQ
jgi:hypothetical protein